jgi:CHAT domain-containing protein
MAFLHYTSGKEAINRNFQDYKGIAYRLYSMVFSGLSTANANLVISPDRIFFPVEALVTTPAHSQPQYLIQRYAISYTYSGQFLLNSTRLHKPKGTQQFLGIAPVRYPNFPMLAKLTESDVSVNRIRNHFSSADACLDSKATKQEFLARFHEYEIIQLYTHGEASSDAGEPAIQFSDAPLYLSELVPEKPVATRFVFLSACETAGGKEFKGEGVFNFSRGFAALGIPASVSMLWQVDNEPTYRITEYFYRYIADGLSKDKALQKAKLEFFRTADPTQQYPYYWAGAVLIGTTDPLVQKKEALPLWMGFVLVISAAIFFLLKRMLR